MRILGRTGSYQVGGKVGVLRGKDHIVIRTENHHFEAVMFHQGVVQLLRKTCKIVWRLHSIKHMANRPHLVGKNLHVKVLEVFFHRRGDDEAERQQHGRGGEDEQQRQTPCDGCSSSQAQLGSCST